MDRIDGIRKSLAAFVCGLFGLVPAIGIPFAVAAIVYFIRARLRKNAEWNPAETHLDWGVRFAILGLVITLLLVALIMAIAIRMEHAVTQKQVLP